MPAYWPSIYFANCFVTAWKRFFRKFSENQKAVYSVNFNMPTVPDSRLGNFTDHGLYTVSAHTIIYACECACMFALAHRMTGYTTHSEFFRTFYLGTYRRGPLHACKCERVNVSHDKMHRVLKQAHCRLVAARETFFLSGLLFFYYNIQM